MPFGILGAVAGAVGAIGSTLIGSRSQRDTNESNERNVQRTNEMSLQAARETNRLSKEMWKQNRKWELRDEMQQYNRMREAAEKAGINPLSVIGAHQGPTTVGAPQLVTPQYQAAQAQAFQPDSLALSQGLAGLADELTGDAALDRAQQKAQTDLMNIQVDQIRAKLATGEVAHKPGLSRIGARRSGTPIPAGAKQQEESVTETVMPGQTRPEARPTMGSAGMVPVFAPDGKPTSIPRRMADRLQVGEWDYLMAEDYEAILGDMGSEPVLAPRFPGATIQLEGEKLDPETRQKAAQDPIGTLGGQIFKSLPKLSSQRPASRYNDPDPEPGWMDRMYGN